MADVKLETMWLVRLSSQELTLIRAALGGRLREDQLSVAEALDDELAQRVVAESKQKLTENSKLERNLKSAGKLNE